MMLWKYETNHNQNTSREWRIYMGSGKENLRSGVQSIAREIETFLVMAYSVRDS